MASTSSGSLETLVESGLLGVLIERNGPMGELDIRAVLEERRSFRQSTTARHGTTNLVGLSGRVREFNAWATGRF